MLFQQEAMRLQLLNVLYWQEETPENRTKPRNFYALSLRLESDAQFDTESQTVKMRDRDLAFVPGSPDTPLIS